MNFPSYGIVTKPLKRKKERKKEKTPSFLCVNPSPRPQQHHAKTITTFMNYSYLLSAFRPSSSSCATSSFPWFVSILAIVSAQKALAFSGSGAPSSRDCTSL